MENEREKGLSSGNVAVTTISGGVRDSTSTVCVPISLIFKQKNIKRVPAWARDKRPPRMNKGNNLIVAVPSSVVKMVKFSVAQWRAHQPVMTRSPLTNICKYDLDDKLLILSHSNQRSTTHYVEQQLYWPGMYAQICPCGRSWPRGQSLFVHRSCKRYGLKWCWRATSCIKSLQVVEQSQWLNFCVSALDVRIKILS